MQNNVLLQAQMRLAGWLTDKALPLWAGRGVNYQNGFAYDYLTSGGTADRNVGHSLAVQAMQIYAFSRAEKMAWTTGRQSSIEQMTSSAVLLGTSPCRSNGFVHVLDSDLRIVDADHYLTDHAWFMMSSAASWHAFNRGTELRRSYNIFEWLQQRYALESGGWSEGSSTGNSLRLSTQIQMCEAIVYIHECCGKEKWAKHASEFLHHFTAHIFDGTINSLTEYRCNDWSADRRTDWLVPGDLYHLVTLLDRIERATAINTREIALGIYRQTMHAMAGVEPGLVPGRLDSNGRALDSSYCLRHLLHQISAAVTASQLGEKAALGTVEAGTRALFDLYLCESTPGLMRDSFTPKDQSMPNRSGAANLSRIVDLAIQLTEATDSGEL